MKKNTSNLLKDAKAVLFDFDGTLADSFEFHIEAWEHVLEKRKIPFNPFVVYYNEGRPVEEIAALILEEAGMSLPEDEIANLIQQKNVHFQKHNQAAPFPGVVELLKKLKGSRRKTGLVTGTLRKNLDAAVDASFLKLFDAIVTVEDAEKGKPAPAPYLAAASKLGLSPKVCLVIENAPMGIASAKAAGMRCAALATTLDAKYLQEADAVYKNPQELVQLITDVTCASFGLRNQKP